MREASPLFIPYDPLPHPLYRPFPFSSLPQLFPVPFKTSTHASRAPSSTHPRYSLIDPHPPTTSLCHPFPLVLPLLPYLLSPPQVCLMFFYFLDFLQPRFQSFVLFCFEMKGVGERNNVCEVSVVGEFCVCNRAPF